MKLSIIKVSLLLLISFGLSYSQVKFSVGPYLGFTEPLGDYSGSTIDYYNGTKYGLGGGVNFGGVFKLKFPMINAKASLFYSSLNNTGNSEADKPNSYVEVKHNLLIIGVGPEFMFNLPGSPVKPYIGVDLLITTFGGESTFQGVSKVPSGTYSMSSATRTGLGLGAGINIGLGSKYSLDVMLRYNMHNLIGRSFSGGENRLSSYTSLNDEKDPRFPDDIDDHPIGSARSIGTLQIDVGFLFDF